MQQKVTGWAFLALICSSTILHTLAYPQHMPLVSQVKSNVRTQKPQYYSNSLPAPHREQIAEERKFAEKSNALKKVALDDLDDIQNNSISDGGSSWSNMLGMIMQMIFNPAGAVGPNKSDNLDTDSAAPSPWTFLFSMGLKILTAILGGATNNTGIDKVDNESSPMQSILAAVLSTVLGAKDPDQVASMAKQAGEFINIVVNLLDALKTSFSHRSLAARSMGKKDSVSDAAMAGIAMLKTYARSFKTNDEKCLQKYLCDANNECSSDIGHNSVFCQLGTYAASFILERQSAGTFNQFYEAGRRGRSGADCRHIYLECNEASDKTMDNYHSQMALPAKQLAERYAEYAGTAHDQTLYYPYEPSPPAQGHHHFVSTKHHYGGGNQKNSAAMSALTLLAFLFFLHILQQCLKDHMTAMSTPQVMIMTGGREGEENIAKQSHSKLDKTGGIDADTMNKRNPFQETNTEITNKDNYLKITTSEDAVWSKSHKYRNNFNKNTAIPETVDQPENY